MALIQMALNSSLLLVIVHGKSVYDFNLNRFDGKYVVFGQLIDGMEVLNTIEACGSTDGTPKAEVKITNCGLLETYDKYETEVVNSQHGHGHDHLHH